MVVSRTVTMVCALCAITVTLAFPQPDNRAFVGGDAATALQDRAARANTEFALELLRRVTQPGKNVFLSPYSISSALAMVYLGARGNTALEIANAAKFSQFLPTPDDVHAVYQSLIQRYNSRESKNFTLNTANHLFGQKGFDILPKFQQEMQDYYRAMLEEVDFKNDPESARNYINSLVSKDTNGKIRELFPPGSLGSDSILALVNAVYFKGTWKTQFDPRLSQQEIFQTTSTSVTTVPMMQVTADFDFSFNEALNSKILRLPYAGDALSLIIVLPETVDGLPELLKKLDSDSIHKLRSGLFRAKVNVKIPKMKVENQFSLREVLMDLGVVDAFSGRADLSGMAKPGEKRLSLSQVRQAAAIEVDEFGTTAAAATGASVIALSAINIAPPLVLFHATHPFFYAIIDEPSKMILFSGVVQGSGLPPSKGSLPPPPIRTTTVRVLRPSSPPTKRLNPVQTFASSFSMADGAEDMTRSFASGDRLPFVSNYESHVRNLFTTMRTSFDPFSFFKFVSFAKPIPPPRPVVTTTSDKREDVL